MSLTIYGSTFSPYVKKVIAFAAEKGLAYKNLQTKPKPSEDFYPEFMAISPLRKMPAMQDGAVGLADSSAICHYLDAAYPAHPLIPADPAARGHVIYFDKFCDTVMWPGAGKIFFNRLVGPKFFGLPGDEAVAKQGDGELAKSMDQFEAAVKPGQEWLVGGALTLADLAVTSMFASLKLLNIGPGKDRPNAQAWVDRMMTRPIFAAMLEKEQHIMGSFK